MVFFSTVCCFGLENDAWRIVQDESGKAYCVQVLRQGAPLLQTPPEGLWSVAFDWQDQGPSDWRHIPATTCETRGQTTLLTGSLPVGTGELHFRDAWSWNGTELTCTRRVEYEGSESLKNVTLAVRVQMVGQPLDAFLPGILYYGNPSGEKNTPEGVPVYHGRVGEFAQFEEHRYAMPFACLEDRERKCAAALFSRPSPVPLGTVPDQWWSLGVRTEVPGQSEFILESGFIGYNGQKSVAKATQQKPLPYPAATMTLTPGTVVEKTFCLDSWPVEKSGHGFMTAVDRSLELYKPYYADDLPTRAAIVRSKLAFARMRWMEGDGWAGFNMYPPEVRQRIVMGWCGQADACGYALMVIQNELASLGYTEEEQNSLRDWAHNAVQKSLDHLATSQVDEKGFSVEYDPLEKVWCPISDPVSMGQAMYNFARAIKVARRQGGYETTSWETFLRTAAESCAARILRDDWSSISTAEAFYIAPLILAADLFDSDSCRVAAEKAAQYYAKRHDTMKEPYWGGTLDARCEDKEGAWAAFQGFATMYEVTGEECYLRWAEHACSVCLSYLVVWDIPLPAGRLADHGFRTRGWTVVSPQNQHLDIYGVLFAPEVRRMGEWTGKESYVKAAEVMFRSCGQLIDPYGSQGEQIQQTNFAQRGEIENAVSLRGGYAEDWTVFWITTHFLVAAAKEMEENAE